tara:strand:- start:289 stop:1161 length:873 start_codon:yes stop_codon:yes gene_type:complete
MKKIFKNLIFFIFGRLAFLFLNILLRKDCIYVVNYHATYPKYEENFIKQLKFYKKYFEIINENFLINGWKSLTKNSKPRILITFDDGHITNFNLAGRILDKFGVKASFFIPINAISRKTEKTIVEENKILLDQYNILSDIKEDSKNSLSRLTMTWENIIDLDNRGHFIGSHGSNHVRLSSDLSDDQLDYEISKSKETIEERLNKKINSFCWIVGDKKSYTKKASEIIKKNNYKLSFTTCGKPFNKNQNLLQIHRFNVEDYFSISRISFIFSGFYELLYLRKRKFVNSITK